VANASGLVERLPMAGGAAKTDRAAQRTRPTISFRSLLIYLAMGSACWSADRQRLPAFRRLGAIASGSPAGRFSSTF